MILLATTTGADFTMTTVTTEVPIPDDVMFENEEDDIIIDTNDNDHHENKDQDHENHDDAHENEIDDHDDDHEDENDDHGEHDAIEEVEETFDGSDVEVRNKYKLFTKPVGFSTLLENSDRNFTQS